MAAEPTVVQLSEEQVPIVPVVGELIVGAIAFGILCYILMKFVFPKMEQMYQNRVEAIEGGLRKAEEAQREANALLVQYNEQLATARAEATQIRDEAREEGHRIVEEMRQTAREESERIVARGAEQLAVDRQHLVTDLRGEMGQLAVNLAERIVGESLADDVRSNRTVERFFDELDDQQTVGAR